MNHHYGFVVCHSMEGEQQRRKRQTMSTLRTHGGMLIGTETPRVGVQTLRTGRGVGPEIETTQKWACRLSELAEVWSWGWIFPECACILSELSETS